MKTKQIIITIAFIFSALLINAQDKYEFMIIEYKTFYGHQLSVSIDGNSFSIEEIELPKGEKSGFNANPLLKKVKEYQDKDWEVININAQIGGGGGSSGASNEIYFAYLRKKKTDKK